MKEYDLDVYDLFPEYEKEKEDMITTDDFISAMKVHNNFLSLQ